MLHTMFRRATGNRVEYFLRVFTIYGQGGYLGHVTIVMLTNFYFPVPEIYIQNLV